MKYDDDFKCRAFPFAILERHDSMILNGHEQPNVASTPISHN